MTRIPPVSTYRLQLRGAVDFAAATDHVSYLHELGVDWLYASPMLRAAPGSAHGYDVIDPTMLDPALGSDEDFERLVSMLDWAGMGLLLDVVPNHMRAQLGNPWWRDQLEHGPASRYTGFFDIRWSMDPQARVVLPVLERHYGEVLEQDLLRIGVDELGLLIRYHDRAFPLDPQTWPRVLEQLPLPTAAVELVEACRALPPRIDTAAVRQRRAEQTPHLRQWLAALLREHPGLHDAITSQPTGPLRDRCDALHALLEAQAYRLAYWRSGLDELNYRRFFDINELVALRMERRPVFDAYHQLVLELVAAGKVHGLRIDHVDGLGDPRAYLERLRAGGVRYLVVEKILRRRETLPTDWDTDGTTGYELIDAVGPLLVDPAGFTTLEADFRHATGHANFQACVRHSKREVLSSSLAPALRNLAADLRALAVGDRGARDVSHSELEQALTALTVALPVYRIYTVDDALRPADLERLEHALQCAREQLPPMLHCALDFIGRVVTGRLRSSPGDDGRAHAFVRRWQQLTGPVTAKGVEDTALYRYVPNLGLDEVGSEPVLPSDPVQAFTRWAIDRREHMPRGLLTLSTHDTKRGADVRARLLALTELPDAYRRCAQACAAGLQLTPERPELREELEVLLQTVIGALPLSCNRDPDDPDSDPDPHEDPAADLDAFAERLRVYLVKAGREAKRRTSWMRPDELVEAEIAARGQAVLDALTTTDWGRELAALQRRIAQLGAINGLAQVVLQLIAPGVCDVYQGTETWDLSLVDPDNRRPVPFDRLRPRIDTLRQRFRHDRAALLPELREHWRDGRIKTHVLTVGLHERRQRPGPYLEGRVVPVQTHPGRPDQHCYALARRNGDAWSMAVIARRVAGLVGPSGPWPLGERWEGATVELPEGSPSRWRELLSGRLLVAEGPTLAVPEIFAELPVALLRADP